MALTKPLASSHQDAKKNEDQEPPRCKLQGVSTSSKGNECKPVAIGANSSSTGANQLLTVANRVLTSKIQEFLKRGYSVFIHRYRSKGKTYTYLRAKKKGKYVTIMRIEASMIDRVKEIITRLRNNSANNINSSSKPCFQASGQPHGTDSDRGGVGGSASVGSGLSGLWFRPLVHRVVLRFVRPWVSPLYLSQFGETKFVGRSKQYILRMSVGGGRWVTVQVNRDGSAQVFLEASSNPLSLEEFIGFSRFYLLWLFSRITGRDVGLEDFIVLAAPEFNIDIDGVNLLEGLGAKSLTLEGLLSDIIRIYYSDPCVKATMPNGGTRVEARPGGYNGMNLKELVEGIVASAELPRFLSSLKKEVEEVKDLVKGGVSLKSLEKQGFADLVAAKLANYLEILWKRIEARLQQWIRELAGKVAGALQDYIDDLLKRIRVLEEENKGLRNRIRELEFQLRTVDKIEEYKHHSGWRKLLELATPGPDHPALINIDLEKGMVYYSSELWRYIRSRTRNGALRGLDKHLLDKVKDYHGEWAVKLLLSMQMRGGKIDLEKALNVITASTGYRSTC